MNFSRHALAASIAAACLAVAACHRDEPARTATVDSATRQHAQQELAQPAWLRGHLPATTVAYLRIPSPWGMVGGVPDGRAVDAATASDANLKAVAALRQAIANDKLLADAGLSAYLTPLLVDLRSPVEAVALDPLGVMSPGTQVLVAMQLAERTPEAVAQRLAALPPAMHLAAPFDAHGNATLAAGLPVHFDAASRRLYLLASKRGASATDLDNALTAVGQASPDTLAARAVAAQEQAIDASGEGLFAWASLHGVGSLATGAIPQQSVGTLPGDLLSKADGIAFGAGSVDGHGTGQLRLHAPQARLLGYLAPSGFDPAFKVAGAPRWVANLALPGDAQWQAFENNLALDFGADRAADWHQAMARLQTRLGFAPSDFARWIGPELIAFEDDAGSYTALRVRDRAALYAHLQQLARAHGWHFAERTIDGATIHVLDIPHGAGDTPPAGGDASTAALKQLFGRLGSHFYWLEDGDFLILAEVPQALADRVAAHPSLALAPWLRQQGYPGRDSLIGFAARTHDARRKAYYGYLQLLQVLDDLSGGQVDLSGLPAAHTLHLPAEGVASMSLGVRPDGLALRLDYAQQPFELLGAGSGGTTGIAVVAILAAIAVPAYQDYVIRSQVGEGMILADPAKIAVAEFRARRGRWPSGNAAAGLAAPERLHGRYVQSVTVGDDGSIRVLYAVGANAKIAGRTLDMTPSLDSQGITWTCHAEQIAPKLLPAGCRPASP
ncbi:MAG TPA: pilin [Dyella sp.]|nr:pilin [Dyella sp.]